MNYSDLILMNEFMVQIIRSTDKFETYDEWLKNIYDLTKKKN